MSQRRSILHSMIVQAFLVASVWNHASSSASESDGVVDWTERRKQSRQRRSLGDITARITGGGGGGSTSSPLAVQGTLWQEFRHGAASVGSVVTPCPDLDYCSSSELSQPLETLASPWTFSLASCMTLTVMEGYHSGQAVYRVTDKGRFLGNTSIGNYSEDCWDNPVACNALPPSVVGQGSWLLTPGNHSLDITIASLMSEYPEDVNDGGWFQLKPASCPVAPTPPPPTCSVLNKGCISTSACCRGLICRKTLVTSGPLRCLKCIPRAQKCATTGHCCTGMRCLPVRTGSTTKVCK